MGTAADGYRIVTFDTICPDEHLASSGRLLGMLIAEIPLGELDLEDSEWTPERLRAAERRCVAIGRHILTALATYPECASVDTWNAEVNDHMNAVNEALGYRSVETVLELQKKL